MGFLNNHWYACLYSLLLLLLGSFNCWGQYNFAFDQSVSVMENGEELRLPWAGGFNSGQYQSIDLNLDGVEDLVVFDRSSNKVNCFLNDNGTYVYSPEYEYLFPKGISNWLVLADYDCDGVKDIFTSSVFGIKVYKGGVENGRLSWDLVVDPIYSMGFSNLVNLQVNVSDVPAIVDIDNDGDLDIVIFNFAGIGTIEYHKNYSLEEDGKCGLNFKRVSNKWGDIEECTCGVYAIGTSCAAMNGKEGATNQRITHAGGKALLLIDTDGDGVKEMIFGDEGCRNLAFFKNDGDENTALFQTYEEDFPPIDPPDIYFPAAYYLDVDHDGVKDLLIAPNMAEGLQNRLDFVSSSWFYKNYGTDGIPDFRLQQKDFLQGEMIDRGENAAPAFADVDQDGKIDMIVGNGGVLYGDQYYATLALYKNVGTKATPAFSLVEQDYLNLSQFRLQHLYPGFADINGDGYMDLYFTGTTDTRETSIYYILSDKGTITPAPLKTLPVAIATDDKPLLANWSNNGFADLVLLKNSGKMEYYEFSGSAVSPDYTLVNSALAGFTDKFQNRNLIPTAYDLDGNRTPELILSGADGKLHLIKDIFNHTTGLEDADSLTISYSMDTLDFVHASRLGRQARIAFAPLFEGEPPVMVVGGRQGGLLMLYNEESVRKPVPSEKIVLNIFPNPATDFFMIRSNQNLSVQVYNALGKKVGDPFSVQQNVTFRYKTDQLAAGIYFVRATNSQGRRITNKVIVL